MADILRDYYTDYSESMQLTCEKCGWSGPANDAPMEMRNDLFDRSCPKCWEMLIIVPWPTGDQTKAAAIRGNEEAMRSCRLYGIEYEREATVH
jgi:hypothetical protein